MASRDYLIRLHSILRPNCPILNEIKSKTFWRLTANHFCFYLHNGFCCFRKCFQLTLEAPGLLSPHGSFQGAAGSGQGIVVSRRAGVCSQKSGVSRPPTTMCLLPTAYYSNLLCYAGPSYRPAPFQLSRTRLVLSTSRPLLLDLSRRKLSQASIPIK